VRRWREWIDRRSGLDGVAPLSIFSLQGRDRQAHLLAGGAREEPPRNLSATPACVTERHVIDIIVRSLRSAIMQFGTGMRIDLRTRSGEGWAIRNIKLRMSRKLIYVSGLLACFRCHLDYSPEERAKIFGDSNRRQEVIEHLETIFRLTPLEIVASVLTRYPHLDGTAKKILNSYDEFVGILYPSGQPRSVASSGPAGWGEVSHGGEIASGHAGQYGQKIILHGNAQAAARFHHRENGCDLWSGLRTAYV
jgi:hypothetical protein